MKVFFYHLVLFALAPGGLQIQIVQSRSALAELGVEVEFLDWMDAGQAGEIFPPGAQKALISLVSNTANSHLKPGRPAASAWVKE